MVEYYSREDVVEFIRSYRCSTDVAFHMEEHLNEIPAADVRPVVCCKDCIYAYPYGLEIKCTKHSGKADRLGEDATYSEFHGEEWYCADAQRKRGKHGKV